MGHDQLLLFLLLTCLPVILAQGISKATVVINSGRSIALTDDNFVCATIDWWPQDKCNYNQCPWGYSSIVNLNISHPLLARAIQAFGQLRIRIGGSLQDQVLYGVPSLKSPCHPFFKNKDGLFGFSTGCLHLYRWDAVNHFFQSTGAIITFGLNALYGRRKTMNGAWIGPWDSTNANDFIKYTISKGYKIDSWEFGNELSGRGIGARVNVLQYGKDLIKLKGIINRLYGSSRSKPSILAPGGFYDQQWYTKLLQVTGPGVVNAMTHHIYNLGAGNDPNLMSKIMDPNYLSSIKSTFYNLYSSIRKTGPWSSAWVGESGGAYNSGGHLVSNTFVDSLCALLWHRLMGKTVLSISSDASPYLRSYAHCSKGRAGVTLLLINLSKQTSFILTVQNSKNSALHMWNGTIQNDSIMDRLKKTVSWVGSKASSGQLKREEYHLSPQNGYLQSQTMLLNGERLVISGTGDIPSLKPVLVNVNSPLYVSPTSIAFIVFPNFDAPACK
ncbi:Heparanase-like protein [Drosera capensis]